MDMEISQSLQTLIVEYQDITCKEMALIMEHYKFTSFFHKIVTDCLQGFMSHQPQDTGTWSWMTLIILLFYLISKKIIISIQLFFSEN